MQPSYKHYLKIIKNTCTGHERPVTIPSEELADLARLAEEHCTVPFVLSSFRGTPFYPSMLQRTRSMMLNYYQIDQFTRHTVSLLEDNGIDLFPNTVSLAIWIFISAGNPMFPKLKSFWKPMDISQKMNSVTII